MEGGKPEYCTWRKTLRARREPITNSTHIWHHAGIEPGPHWWEVSTLTTAPSLLPTPVFWTPPPPHPQQVCSKVGKGIDKIIFFLLGKKTLVSLDIHLVNVMDCLLFLLNGLVGNRSW